MCLVILITMLFSTLIQNVGHAEEFFDDLAAANNLLEDENKPEESVIPDGNGTDEQNETSSVIDDPIEPLPSSSPDIEENENGEEDPDAAALPTSGNGFTWSGNINSNSFEIVWNENWGWASNITNPGKLFRPRMTELNFKVQLYSEETGYFIVDAQSDSSTKPYYIDFSQASSTSSTWPVSVTNIPSNYRLTGIAV